MDWAVHLAVSPGKQLHLMEQAMQNTQTLSGAQPWAAPAVRRDLTPDRRFAGEGWQKYPFNVWSAGASAVRGNGGRTP